MIYSQKKIFKHSFILAAGLVATVLFQYFAQNDIYQEYLQLDIFFFTLFPLIASLVIYIIFQFQPDYIFDENYIQVINRKNTQHINKSDIEQIAYFITKGKYSKTLNLVIITNDQERYLLTDSYYKNFNKIKYFLQQNYQVDERELNETADIRIILAIILFFILIVAFLSIENNSQKNGLQKIEVVLLKKPTITDVSKGNSDKIEFKFKKLENFSVEFLFKKENRNYVETVISGFHKDDTLIIEIYKDYYEKKIIKTKSLTFIDKHFKYDELPLYYVGKKDSSEVLIKPYP